MGKQERCNCIIKLGKLLHVRAQERGSFFWEVCVCYEDDNDDDNGTFSTDIVRFIVRHLKLEF